MPIKLEKTSQTPKVFGNSTGLTANSDLYAQIAALREDKELSHAKIAKELHVSKSTVQKYLKLWRERVPVADVKQAGRPRKITVRVKRQIRAIVSKNPSYSSKDIMNQLAKGGENSSSVDVSSRAVRLALNEMSYKNDLPKGVPMLTEVQKTKRLTWCKKNSKRRWEKVIFSDETSIELDRCKTRRWHPKGKRPKVGKTKFSRKIMFWSAIGANCKAPLIVLKGTVNTDKYIELLESHFLPWFRENCPATHTFQQDNAPAHKSKRSIAFINDQNLKLLDWPANSPDLNPIENIWSVLKNAVEKRSPKTLEELERAAIEEWDKIDQQTIRKTIKTMNRRIDQVLERKGEKCEY
jgi:transposase/predicted transcriptional regulator